MAYKRQTQSCIVGINKLDIVMMCKEKQFKKFSWSYTMQLKKCANSLELMYVCGSYQFFAYIEKF